MEQTRSVGATLRASGTGETDIISVLRAKSGSLISLRFADLRDREKVQAYIRSLSVQARYNRFHAGMAELPAPVLEHFIHVAQADRFTVLATTMVDGFETVVGEACYALDADATWVELALSVHDGWQGRGIGKALLQQLEGRAAASGARCIFGYALESNERVCGFARVFGYASAASPDWRLIRLEKAMTHLEPQDPS
jgi:GNAT superfamily N-acetyltransferase